MAIRRLVREVNRLMLAPARRFWFDRRHGVDTRRAVDLASLDIASVNRRFGVDYEPSSTRRFHRMLRALRLPWEEFTFVDLGCGKGKVLLLASEYPFQRIVGVEFAPELADCAARNCHRYRSRRQRCRDFQILCRDAAKYRFPPPPLVVYMFNPFRQPVMESVIENLRQRTEPGARDVYVLYCNPKLKSLFERAGYLEKIGEQPTFCMFRANS